MIVTPELVRLLDDAARTDIESLRDGYFFWLQLSTAIVGLGCVLEVPEVVHELWPDLTKNEKIVRRIKAVASVGLLFIILGIMGEFYFEDRVSTAEGILQRFDEILIAETQREAAETYERAAVAMREAESAKLDAEDAKIRAQGANDKTDQEAKKREELGAKIAGRELSKDQQKDIGAACAKLYTYGSKKRILVRSYGMDDEGGKLAKEISAGLASSILWNSISTGDIQSGVLDEGILIFGPPEDEPFTTCFGNALVEIGKLTNVSVNGESHGGARTSGTVKFTGNVHMTGNVVVPAGFRAAGSQVDILVGKKPTSTK